MLHYAQILANKVVITTFSLVPVKYGVNHTAAMGVMGGETGMLLYIAIKNIKAF